MKKSSQTTSLSVNLNARELQTLQGILSLDFEKVITDGISGFLAEGGRLLAKALMDAEVNSLCGPRYQHQSDRAAHRWGTETGNIVLQGTKQTIDRPRVRRSGKRSELRLATYDALHDQNVLDSRFLSSVLSGTSTRQYQSTIEKGLRKAGVSKSSVSRGAIRATKPIVDAFLSRDLEQLNIVALFIDGIHLGKHQVLVAIGVGASGRKHVLGLKPGASENEIVCRDLIRDLLDRGLNSERNYLFIIDGSKALAKAVRAAFGNETAIQRCHEHKIRDVEAYLPVKSRMNIRSKLRAAWNAPSEKQALKRLSAIRLELLNISENAANSLTEGMLDTLTLHRLGIRGQLRESLRTTNVIESAFSAARRLTAKTTRYRSEAQIVSHLARGLCQAEKNFRPVRGNRQLSKLFKKLNP